MQKWRNNIDNIKWAHIEIIIPLYAIFSFIACWILNCLIFWGTQNLMSNAYHYDFTNDFDRAVPFVPAWVLIYILSYFFWAVNYALIAKKNTKEFWFRFVTADMLSRLISGIIFIILPTTNVRPEIIGDGVLDNAMAMIYTLDQPFDLFPSLHCLASWMCFLGIRNNNNVSKGYKLFTLVFALLICASTQFTKQHYIVDVFGGLAIAEITFFISKHTNWYLRVMAIFDKINSKVFRGIIYEK